MESENPAMKILRLLSVLEYQGGYIRSNITIHTSTVRGTLMEKYGEYGPS